MLVWPFETVTLHWIVANASVSESTVRRSEKAGWLVKVGNGYTLESVRVWSRYGYPTEQRDRHVQAVQERLAVGAEDEDTHSLGNGKDQKGSRGKRKGKARKKKPTIYYVQDPGGSMEGNGA